MTQIAQIEALDLTKIINKDIKNEIQKLTEEYNTAEDKKDFIEATKESATLILEMVQDVYPEAIAEKEKPCVEVVVSSKEVAKPTQVAVKKEVTKPKQTTLKKKVVKQRKAPSSKKENSKTDTPKKQEVKSKQVKKKSTNKKSKPTGLQGKLQALQEEVEECRKRGAIRKSPKKKTTTIPKTMYEKVYSHINAIANLVPERFRDDKQKIAEVKRMSLHIHKKVVGVFQMNETLAEKGKVALKQKFKDITKRIEANDNK
ncbi:hypothetical protein ACFO3O_22170 [Dokdonia ponticola]|uniref:Uncharacterized protein n=1 Tax=Dokdonia ponticola TaxID=2041041 RepID=A0ABV9I3C6_9FLAO